MVIVFMTTKMMCRQKTIIGKYQDFGNG